MKKLTLLVENLQQEKIISSIDTIEQYQQFVDEHLKQFAGYSQEMSQQISESLLESSGNDIQSALAELKNFQMHG